MKSQCNKDIVEVGCEGVKWINLAKTRDKRRALVEAEMGLTSDFLEQLSALELGL